MAYELGKADLEPLLLGGCFFGSGGGGTVISARHLASNFKKGAYYPSGTVTVVSVDEATEGETAMVAYMGAPEAIDGAKYPIGPVLAAMQVQARLASEGKKLAYVVGPESGALGFTVACLVAAKLGLKVIDADGAGRAVPSLPMLTYASEHVSPRPAFLVSQEGLIVELDVTPREGKNGNDQHQQDVSEIVEQMMRPIVGAPQFNQFGGLAMWVMDPKTLRKALPIRGTLSRALAFGRELLAGKFKTADDVIAALKSEWGVSGQVLFGPATVESAKVDTTGGFDLGTVTLKAGDETCSVLYENESLLAWSSTQPHPLCMAPDSISYFVLGKGQAVFSNGDLVQDDGTLSPDIKGRKVVVLGMAANPNLRIPGGLILDSFMTEAVTLGYHGPYVPVEKLNKGASSAKRAEKSGGKAGVKGAAKKEKKA